jgi:hypothetical protein
MLGIDYSYTCHSFLAKWSPYLSRCNSTCWDWHFPLPNGTTKYPNHVTPSCLTSSPTLWKPNGSILSLVASFFGRSPTQARIYLACSKKKFIYHANIFLFMYGSKGKCLVINSSYHTYISFIINPFPSNTAYPSWLATSYNCPSFTMCDHTIDNLSSPLL